MAINAFIFRTRQPKQRMRITSCRSTALSTQPIRFWFGTPRITAWSFLLIRLLAGFAAAIALLLCSPNVSLAQIPAGDDIGYRNAAVSGRCVGSDLVAGGTSIRVSNWGSAGVNGVAIIALNLSRNECVSLNTPPGAVQIAAQAYGSGCAALYYMVWRPRLRDPWFYWLRPADAHALMCTADTLSTIPPTDTEPTAYTGKGQATRGVGLTTRSYLDHIYSI